MTTDAFVAPEFEGAADQEQPSSYPNNINFQFLGYEEDTARKLAHALADMLIEIGRIIEITTLDGVTVAYDYDAALATLDRGYKSSRPLERTTDVALGIAMTPSVLRDDVLKSHVVIHGAVADLAQSEDKEQVRLVVHTLAHECAHVETTAAWEGCFPGELLRKSFDTLLDAWRSEIYMACWDEYSACRITGVIGQDPTEGYAETFLASLGGTEETVRALVQGFHGGNADDFVGPVFGAYGTLMKFACYYMGALAGAGDRRHPVLRVQEALQQSWFRNYYDRLENICARLFSDFGQWPDKSGFDEIADLMEEIVNERVMRILRNRDGSYQIWIHHQDAYHLQN